MSVLERFLKRPPGDDELTISTMRKRDLRAGVLAIEAGSYPRPWSPDVFAGELAQLRSGSRYYLVARRRGEVAGYAGLWFTGDEAHVTNIAVRPDLRRRGIARRLLSALADEVVDRGCTAWTLEVRVSSVGAQELYAEFGFEPAGVRRRYYENVEDAIVMWCHGVQTVDYRRRLDRIRQGAIDE